MIKFSFNDAYRVQQELRVMNEQYNDKIEKLVGYEKALCTMWEGPAKEVFHASFLVDIEQMRNVFQLVNQYILALDIISNNYRKAEQKYGTFQGGSFDWIMQEIKESWDIIARTSERIQAKFLDWIEHDYYQEINALRESLGFPENMDQTLEEFLQSTQEDKLQFLERWNEILHFSDDEFGAADGILEFAGTMFRDAPLCLVMNQMTSAGILDDFFDAADFECESNNPYGHKVYHVNVDKYGANDTFVDKIVRHFDKDGFCWQQLGGYNDLYDKVFDVFCDMDANRDLTFTSKNGEEFTIWLWKGDYLNLGAGGELGIYSGNASEMNGIGLNHVNAATDNELPITMSVDYGDGTIIEYDANDTWWATTFDSDKRGIDAEDITITYTVDFSKDMDMWGGFVDKANDLRGNPDCNLEIELNEETHTATIIF